MQTFLPYADVVLSVEALDCKRLGNQRREARQILSALADPNYGWQHHPAVKMWRGHEELLKHYHNACILEWQERGYKNHMSHFEVGMIAFPEWWNGKIHETHRSNLLRKDYEYYKHYGWSEPDNLEYYWPV